MNMLNQNKIIIGLICGLIVPFVAYAIFDMIYDYGDSAGWFTNSSVSETFRSRTKGLLAIATNLITINVFRRKRHEDSMRGVVIATAIYVLTWIILFGKTFLS